MTVTVERFGVAAGDAYCPHCYLLVEAHAGDSWPAAPQRCPHCRLMIGAGRARERADGIPGARGAAAGVMAERARRSADDAVCSPGQVLVGIRAVAERLGIAPERLLMVDYQQETVADSTLPELHDVLAAFGSWKSARREAAHVNG